MGQGYLIDSDIVIGYLNGKLNDQGMAFMHTVVNKALNISIMTKIEVLSFNATEASYKLLTDFIDTAAIFDLDDGIVQQTIALRKAHKIKTPDAIIAATAMTHKLTLITRNTADFKKVTDIKLSNPYDL